MEKTNYYDNEGSATTLGPYDQRIQCSFDSFLRFSGDYWFCMRFDTDLPEGTYEVRMHETEYKEGFSKNKPSSWKDFPSMIYISGGPQQFYYIRQAYNEYSELFIGKLEVKNVETGLLYYWEEWIWRDVFE